ncbi:MAG: prepilin peptidase [Planctomycetaceae bacterium]
MNSLASPNDPVLRSSPCEVGRSSQRLSTGSQHSTSLFAEYGRMLLCVHAIFCVALRLLMAGDHPATFAGMIASLWVALRIVRIAGWQWWFLLCSTGSLLLLLLEGSAGQVAPPMIGRGPFSSVAVFSMLALVLTMDAAEFIVAVRQRLRAPHIRDRLASFVMRHGLRMLLWGTVGFILTYSIVVPVVQEAIWQRSDAASEALANPKFAMDRLTLPENMLFKFSESISGMWFFIVGCCVGSFLNVVIYRVPAGISVLVKASHCPVCQTKIASRDNLPLIGWLKLQGRCRNCGTSISSRYPSVEVTIGLVFFILYFVELISGGTNLPGRTPNFHAGVLWIIFWMKAPDLIGLYLFHCFVLCAVFSWTMMGRDGHRVPVKAAAITIGLTAVAALLWPHLLPWKNGEILSLPVVSDSLQPFAATSERLLSGAVIGFSAGWLACRAGHLPFQAATWLLIGMALGWKAAVGIGLLCLAAKFLVALAAVLAGHEFCDSSDRKVIASWWWLPTVLLIHHCLWRQLAAVIGGAA